MTRTYCKMHCGKKVLLSGAGLEHGSIKHEPSIAELLNRLEERLPVDTVAWRRTLSFVSNPEAMAPAPALEGSSSSDFPSSDQGEKLE